MKIGKEQWHMSDFINCIKEDVDARENCDFMKDKNDYEHLRNTTYSLLGVQKLLGVLMKITLHFVKML